MAETKKEQKVYRIDYICDLCNKGVMEFTSEVKTSNPPWYCHKCSDCGNRKDFHNIKYPHISYE